jgi:hypothetical protein
MHEINCSGYVIPINSIKSDLINDPKIRTNQKIPVQCSVINSPGLCENPCSISFSLLFILSSILQISSSNKISFPLPPQPGEKNCFMLKFNIIPDPTALPPFTLP